MAKQPLTPLPLFKGVAFILSMKIPINIIESKIKHKSFIRKNLRILQFQRALLEWMIAGRSQFDGILLKRGMEVKLNANTGYFRLGLFNLYGYSQKAKGS
jgi:hypothetical protein